MTKITEKVNEIIKEAMISKNSNRLNSARNLKKAFMDAAKAKGAVLDSDGTITDTQAIQIMSKLAKTLRETADLYQKQGRMDLWQSEMNDLVLVEEFLPKMLSLDETKKIVEDTIKEVNAQLPKEMGKVIGAINKKYAGQVDGKAVADLVKSYNPA